MSDSTLYVGLDVHKDLIQVAIHRFKPDPMVEWEVANIPTGIASLINKLKRLSPGCVELCYEAGGLGYGLARKLNKVKGFHCIVVAPSLIPTKPGDRVKTDRRDARKLAEYLRSNLLTEVQPPSPKDEARRELSRARGAAKTTEKKAMHRISKFLLRQGRRYSRKAWTKTHRKWLEAQQFDIPELQTVFDSLVSALEHAISIREELDKALEEASKTPEVVAPVGLLKCFKGFQTTTSMSCVTELYSFERFAKPGSLMSFLGMTPSERSSVKRRPGSITKAGNSRIRRLLVEAAWNSVRSSGAGKDVKRRRKGQPRWAIDIAEKAQKRLYQRYRALTLRGLPPNKAIMAVARELVGFIWAMLSRHTHNVLSAQAQYKGANA